MALVYADLVMETTLTNGTGAFTLAGAVTGYQSFSVVGNGNTCYYCAEAVDAGTGIPTGEWEVGLGTWATGGTLARTAVLASSNAGSPVSFSAGTKRVSLVVPASRAANIVFNDIANTFTVDQTLGSGVDIITNTGTGTMIGTAASQKLALWGASPVVQPTAVADADGTLGSVNAQFNALLAKLRTIGVIAT